MPDEAPRAQVLDAIEERLKAITVGSGFHFTAKRVTQEYLVPDQVTEYPTLVVIEEPDMSELNIGDMGGLGADPRYKHVYFVLVIGYVRGDDTLKRPKALERLWDDVVKKLLGDPTLGGLVEDIVVAQKRETDGGLLDPVGAFAQPFAVIFREAITGA